MLNCQDKAEQPFLLMFVGFGIDEMRQDKPNQVCASVTYIILNLVDGRFQYPRSNENLYLHYLEPN